MGLPKSKYSDPFHTPGNEFTLKSKPYIGWFIRTYQNEYYTGKVFDDDSKLLTPIVEERPDRPVFDDEVVEPSTRDRVRGELTRYFVQRRSNLKIVEVNRGTYNKFLKDPEFINAELLWKIKGPADNQSINGYTYFGASHVNQINTAALEKTVEGITSFIKDYSQFVE